MFKHTKKILASLFILAGITLFISCQEQQPVATNDAGQMNLSKVSTFVMPAGATLVSANLKLYAWSWAGNPHNIDIHSITAPWSCPVSWNSFAGAYNPTVITTFNMRPVTGAPDWNTIDITATVQAWLSGGTNYGLLLKNQDVMEGLARWWSNEYVANTTWRPYLEIVTTAGTIEVEPSIDTYIYEIDPDLSFCSEEDLFSGFITWNQIQYEKQTLIRFDIEPTPQCYQEETAWAANGLVPGSIRYVPRGNWATYLISPTDINTPKTVNIYAGKTIYVGQATITKLNGTVDIDIVLSGGWELDPMETEAVKIQGYSTTPPAKNPAPGLFTTYKGNGLLNITVPYFAYYGIHIDVRKPIICP